MRPLQKGHVTARRKPTNGAADDRRIACPPPIYCPGEELAARFEDFRTERHAEHEDFARQRREEHEAFERHLDARDAKFSAKLTELEKDLFLFRGIRLLFGAILGAFVGMWKKPA